MLRTGRYAVVALSLLVLWSGGRGTEIRHRCGTSTPYRDHLGRLWLPDQPFRNGSWGYLDAGIGTASTADEIRGTLDDPLYRTERYGPQLQYRYEGLPNGVYRVTFRFAEIYWNAPQRRVFDVAVNDLLLLDDLDIYAKVGHDAALDTSIWVKVRDGAIRITVPEVKVDYAKFAAIEIEPAGADEDPPPSPGAPSGFFWNNAVHLTWSRVSAPDLDGYEVERGSSPSGPFQSVSAHIVKSVRPVVEFIDPDVRPGSTYFYRVRAVDAFGNASNWSPPAAVVTTPLEEIGVSIPEVAWRRPIGVVPRGATGRTKRGVPLGGIGAGNFMFNLCGTFGPWEFKTGLHEEKFLSAAAFHLWFRNGTGQGRTVTLATDDVLTGWNRLPPGSGAYFALYPRAWFVYQGFPFGIVLTQLTPIIPHNYRETSYPVGLFQFVVSNPTPDTVEVALAFTFPNADYGDLPRYGKRAYARSAGDVLGVVLDAESVANSSVTQGTEWCIATLASLGGTVSWGTGWDASGDGSDFYGDFADDGLLSNATLGSRDGAAVAVKRLLEPGGEWRVPFALAWDFPVVEFGEGTRWYRRYTEYFGTGADNAFDIAVEALRNRDAWEAMVEAWQRKILDEPAYPDWLKQAALNELYYDTFGGVFWENGCITKPAESSYGTLPPEDHKYFCMECQDYPFCETFDVRHYECRHYLVLWPEIERDVLRWFADYIANDPEGKAPHDAGSPSQDPFFRFSGYGADWQDMPSKFIQQVYAYYRATGDEAFLDFVWPACKKTYAYMKTKDTNGNGLPDVGNTTYDTWFFHGDNLLAGCLWIGALEAMDKLAEAQGEGALRADVQRQLSLARAVLDHFFWVEEGGYYRLDRASDALMADGLNGSRYCETTGLGPVLPPERIASHLHRVYELCVAPLRDYNGDGEGDMGAVNGRNADGSPIGRGQADEVWTGSSYFIAAMMVHWGKELGDELLVERGLKTAYGVYYQTWINEETAYFFNTPEAWHYSDPRRYRAQQYQRPRAIWELLLEIKNPFQTGSAVANERRVGPARAFGLRPAYPNPFNGSTRLLYTLPEDSRVRLIILDVRGRSVATLVDSWQPAGTHTVVWQGLEVPSGVYLAVLRATTGREERVATTKLVLVK